MIHRYFDAPHTLRRLRSGVTGPFISGFALTLEEAGYSRQTIRFHLRFAGHLGHWATERCVSIHEFDEAACKTFLRHLQHCQCLRPNQGKYYQAAGAVRLFLSYLRQLHVVPPKLKDEGPCKAPLVVAFRDWMGQHRGVTDSTLELYDYVITDFLETVGDDPGRFEARGLRAFVLDRVEHHARSSAKNVTSAMRMFLRYLIAEGKCPAGLDAAIPRVAHWRLSALPRYLSASDVERVIAACNVSTQVGWRDRAIILLLARLGLRGGDIVRLQLTDIDWREASVRVLGKGRREVRLPLTQEVGDAMLAYLEHGRPAVSTNRLFVRSRAPSRPLSESNSVSSIVARALHRAGVVSPFRGAHVLRHSAATEMLRQGVSLQSIGAVLRHRSIETTEIYAKVDVALLRLVAQPWPEVMSC